MIREVEYHQHKERLYFAAELYMIVLSKVMFLKPLTSAIIIIIIIIIIIEFIVSRTTISKHTLAVAITIQWKQVKLII